MLIVSSCSSCAVSDVRANVGFHFSAVFIVVAKRCVFAAAKSAAITWPTSTGKNRSKNCCCVATVLEIKAESTAGCSQRGKNVGSEASEVALLRGNTKMWSCVCSRPLLDPFVSVP